MRLDELLAADSAVDGEVRGMREETEEGEDQMAKRELVPVMVQWNYWRNGMFQDVCEGVEIAGLTLHDFSVPAALEKSAMVIGWRVFPIEGHQEWVGNWCWDMVWMKPKYARRLIRYLAYLDASPESGPTEIWDRFEALKKREAATV